jgi:putative glutamine amidotransferase
MLRIGITADWREEAGHRRMVLNAEYAEWIQDAGMLPVVLPSLPGSEDRALEGVSGVLLTGGGDIRPHMYGADPEPLPEESFSHGDRSAFEFALVWRSLRIGMPLLGICLGCQTLNAAAGGDLIRHLEDPLFRHRRKGPGEAAPKHRLHVAPGTLAAELYPSADTRVLSSHHQAVARMAPGWKATAWGPDGVVEAIENPSFPHALGVQWHPERTPHSLLSKRLTAWLKAQASAYAKRRSGS